MEADLLTPQIKGILVLDNTGKRIAVKYYSPELGDFKKQQAFEADLFKKTHKTSAQLEAEVITVDKFLSVYKFYSDVFFYVIASSNENELIVLSVLNAIVETIDNLLRNMVDKKTLLENLDLLLLAIDDIVDEGIILETDTAIVSSRVAMRSAEKDIAEKTLTEAWKTARDQVLRSFQ